MQFTRSFLLCSNLFSGFRPFRSIVASSVEGQSAFMWDRAGLNIFILGCNGQGGRSEERKCG